MAFGITFSSASLLQYIFPRLNLSRIRSPSTRAQTISHSFSVRPATKVPSFQLHSFDRSIGMLAPLSLNALLRELKLTEPATTAMDQVKEAIPTILRASVPLDLEIIEANGESILDAAARFLAQPPHDFIQYRFQSITPWGTSPVCALSKAQLGDNRPQRHREWGSRDSKADPSPEPGKSRPLAPRDPVQNYQAA